MVTLTIALCLYESMSSSWNLPINEFCDVVRSYVGTINYFIIFGVKM